MLNLFSCTEERFREEWFSPTNCSSILKRQSLASLLRSLLSRSVTLFSQVLSFGQLEVYHIPFYAICREWKRRTAMERVVVIVIRLILSSFASLNKLCWTRIGPWIKNVMRVYLTAFNQFQVPFFLPIKCPFLSPPSKFHSCQDYQELNCLLQCKNYYIALNSC